MRHLQTVTLYVRQKNGDRRYAFEPIAGQGRKPTKGRYYLATERLTRRGRRLH